MTNDPESLLFPIEIGIVSADACSTYAMLIARFSPAGFAESMLDAHRRSLSTHELAQLFRSAAALDDVEQAAATFAPRLGRDPSTAGVEAVVRYKRGLAEQLADVDGHGLQAAARAYLAACAQRDRAEADERRQHEIEVAERRRQEALEQSRKREAAEARAAEVRAAREKAATVESQLEALHREHRRVRLQWLRSELQSLGVDALRVNGVRSLNGAGSFFGRGRYAVSLLIDQLDGMSAEQLTAIEHAVSAELERQETT